MSAQRNDRFSSPRRNQEQDPTARPGRQTNPGQRQQQSDSDWASSQGDGSSAQPGNAAREQQMREGQQGAQRFMREQQQQQGSQWNEGQDPEHPERPADGGRREMRANSRSNEKPSGNPGSPAQPENGDRGRGAPRRRSES